MTQEELDPRVQSLLEDALESRDLELDVAERLFEVARRLEGDELEETVRSILRSA